MFLGSNKSLAFALMVCVAVICITEIRGCQLIEETSDKCRDESYIHLSNPVDANVDDGAGTKTFSLPTNIDDMHWYCGSSEERVAWGGGANKVEVNYNGADIMWKFLYCP